MIETMRWSALLGETLKKKGGEKTESVPVSGVYIDGKNPI